MTLYKFIIPVLISIVFASNSFMINENGFKFDSSIDSSLIAKEVELRKETPYYSPQHEGLSYDTTKYKIYRTKYWRETGNKLTANEVGILSSLWGVKDESKNRYLNIMDLQNVLNGEITIDVLNDWIIGGRVVRSKEMFLKFVKELHDSGVVDSSPPHSFKIDSIGQIGEYRYISGTILFDNNMMKLHYAIDEKKNIMFIGKESLFDIGSHDLKPNQKMNSKWNLTGVVLPKDKRKREAYLKTLKYRDLLKKYEKMFYRQK